jgi:NADPH2:quinone reductase
VVEDVKKALNGKKLLYAYDAISEDDSLKNVFSLLDQGGKMTTVLPTEIEVPSHITLDRTYVGTSHDGPASEQDFASAYFRLFGRWMKEKRFEGHPYEVVPGGLEGVEEGLRRLQDGKVSAKKLVYKIADTPGL